MRRLLLLTIFALSIYTSKSQNLSFSCPRDTILGCNASCLTVKGQFPDLRGLADDYSFKDVTAASVCRPYVDPGGPGPSSGLSIDDTYSPAITLPFSFPFYGTVYNTVYVSANGYVMFSNPIGTFSHYGILNSGGFLSATSGTPQDLPSTLYDKAIIMGPYHDLDPAYTTSPTSQIKYETYGNAPNRKWILSFYKVPLFDSPTCSVLIENTHQIILHESTGVVEVFVKDMQICTIWNEGRSMIGMQDQTGTKGIMAPGRRASDPAWGSLGMNETWRFIPLNGSHLYRSVELLDATGTVVATGDTTRLDANTFETSFPNICPPAGNSLYVIKTTYQKIDDPTPGATIYSLDTINVVKQAALPVTATMTPTTCGMNTGTITVTVAGGVGPYSYSLDGGAPQPGNVFINVSSGPHTVTATDAFGCTNTIPITVTSISSLPCTLVIVNTSCPGVNNGSITVTPTAGTAPYSYSLNGGPSQPTGVFPNLAPGPYTISFTDANNCTGDTTATITTGAALTASSNTNGTSCAGQNNGSTTITPTSGTAPYSFSLDGGPTQPTGVFTGLTPGSHTITFTDANGCTGTSFIFVGTGAGITSTISSNGTSCPGVNNGTITLTPTNGTGPFTYSLDGGPFLPANPITGVASGIHTVTIKDATGCTGTNSTAVNIGIGNTGTISSTGASCPGINDGTITATATSGTAPFTYTLDGGTVYPTGNISGVSAGAHTVVITDLNGCIVSLNTTVSAGPAVTGSAVATNTSCPGVSDGTITVTPGGIPPYTYTLTSASTGTIVQPNNPVFTNLPPDTYTITFTTGSGCNGTVTSPSPLVILAGPALTGSATHTNTSCPGVNDGTITVIPGGNPPYTYTLTSVSTGTIVQLNNPVFTNLPPDTYTITFTTGSGCNGTVTSPNPLVVLAGPPLTSSFTQFDPPCANIDNGTITINPSGVNPGVAPYAYILTGPGGPYNQATPTFSNLAPGVYNYSFTDGNGCSGTGGPVTLVTNAPIGTTVTLTMPLCNGGSTGIITLSASGGVTPYQYALSPFAAYQASGTFNNLATGTYTFRIKDFAGCTKDTTVTLGEPTLLTASATNTAPASCSGNDGIITVTGFDGTPAYQYSIDNGANYQASNIFTAPNVGPYPNIKVKDANGCVANASTTVVLVDAMFLTLGPDTTICVGSSVKMLPQTSAGTSIYNWRPLDPIVTNPNTIDTSTIRNATMTPTDTATYILNAKWGACVREDTIVVNVLHKPIPNAGLDTVICNQTYAILRGSATNLSGPVYYVWAPAASVQEDSAAVTIATPGSNTQLYVLTVTDDYGCNFTVKDSVLVSVQPPVPAFAGNDTTAILGVPHQLFGSGGVDYLWSPSFPLNLATSQNPLATLINDQQFVLKVTDFAGCVGYDTVFVQVYVGPNYYVPSAFSPNGDGLNDVFRAIPVGIAKTEWFRVFNRYGQLMFETSEWLKGWDGKYKGKLQPMGAYVWMVKGVDKNGRIVEMKGTVTLVQ